MPLELKGEPKGEAEGGVLQQIITELEIECLVTDIPDVDPRTTSSEMGLDDVLHIKDLKLPPGVRALQDEDLIVATVKEDRGRSRRRRRRRRRPPSPKSSAASPRKARKPPPREEKK